MPMWSKKLLIILQCVYIYTHTHTLQGNQLDTRRRQKKETFSDGLLKRVVNLLPSVPWSKSAPNS